MENELNELDFGRSLLEVKNDDEFIFKNSFKPNKEYKFIEDWKLILPKTYIKVPTVNDNINKYLHFNNALNFNLPDQLLQSILLDEKSLENFNYLDGNKVSISKRLNSTLLLNVIGNNNEILLINNLKFINCKFTLKFKSPILSLSTRLSSNNRRSGTLGHLLVLKFHSKVLIYNYVVNDNDLQLIHQFDREFNITDINFNTVNDNQDPVALFVDELSNVFKFQYDVRSRRRLVCVF